MADHHPDPRHWRRRLRITALLLMAWFVVTFGVTYFARELGDAVLGWPLSFWMTAQGTVLVYVALVWVYARLMARLDAEFDVAEGD
jgi:putative solute:sodium symporter small subunit